MEVIRIYGLLASDISKLGFFNKDFSGVALDSGLDLTLLLEAANKSSMTVGSSTELKGHLQDGNYIKISAFR